MQRTIVCNGCDERLAATAAAMRSHASVMHAAIEEAKAETLTDERRKDYTDALISSFNVAQTAWDAYREHLSGHPALRGLLPALRSRDAA